MVPRRQLAFIIKWNNAAMMQVRRLMEQATAYEQQGMDAFVGRPLGESSIDGEFLIIALSQLWRALRWRQDEQPPWWPPAVEGRLKSVLDSFDGDLLPDSDARDVVMHFDDYASGVGGRRDGERNRTALISVGHGFSPDVPGTASVDIVINIREVQDAQYRDLAPYHLNATAVEKWRDYHISPLINLLVETDRAFDYKRGAPPYY